MLMPQFNYISCKNFKEEYRMFYTAWGCQETSKKTLICVHGLNRNGRDWDRIGYHFAQQGYYVIAPDLVGRGNSDYLQDPMQYDTPYYIADLLLLIKTLGLVNIEWLGLSLGAVIGMAIAALEPMIIQKLILVDMGAEIESIGLARIAKYSVAQPEFDTYAQIFNYLLDISRDFGDLPPDIWEGYIRNEVQKNSHGKYELKRDVNLLKPMLGKFSSGENMQLWSYWEKIKIPSLIIRGEVSDILSVATVEKMKQLNPQAQSIEIAKAGHAPYLYNAMHLDMLEKFLGLNER
ncbi:MAG: alpha/beta hydrolase [Burkholderiales bacterium]|nr:alpha/beta hydrolase [Burkholderiales bacterium]